MTTDTDEALIEDMADAYHKACEAARTRKREAYASLGREPTEAQLRTAPADWLPAVLSVVRQHDAPRIAALEAEVARLRGELDRFILAALAEKEGRGNG